MSQTFKKIPWSKLEKLYVGKKYVGKNEGRQVTFKVVDTTLGGGLVICRRGYQDETVSQDWFLKFISKARQVG